MKNKNYPKFINEFVDYLAGIKNFSSIYIKNTLVTLQSFLNFVNTHIFENKYKSIEEMSLNDIRYLSNSGIYSFIFYLAENHYKIGSRLDKIGHLKTFFDYLYRIKNSLFKEPFKQIKREKNIYTQLPNYLSLNEAKKLCAVYSNSSQIKDIRNNAMINLFLQCGLRLSEVVNLKISNFDFKDDKFLILGKGSKERTGYLNKPAKEALLNYLEIRKNIQTKKAEDEDILFISNKRTRFTPRRIERIIKQAYIDSGIENDEYSVHTLRHTCATLLYKSGADIKIIKEILGHVKIETTEIYTHLHNLAVKKAMQEHPLAKFKMQNALDFCAA